MTGQTRWILWLFVLAVWTVALLRPEPAQFHRDYVSPWTDWPVSKFVHVGAYAFLAATAAGLPLPRGRRWLLLLILSLHGMLTEYFQTFVSLRTGQWSDVLLNHLGIGLGVAIAWRWWVSSVPIHPPRVFDWSGSVPAQGLQPLGKGQVPGTCLPPGVATPGLDAVLPRRPPGT